MKKRIAVLLTVAMATAAVFSPMTAAAASGTASSIRLEQTKGSVSVKNSAGKDLKASSGARLNSGSSVSTAKASYAYMSLDSSKAAKLDASSKASVRKSGSKLELRSEKGSLMFNVSSPLKSSESMNIRTSSMVAGVRGTAGWVFNLDANTSVIYLLEGTLDIVAVDPLTGEQKQVAITGGQGVFATLDTTGKYTKDGITITIPGMGGPRTIIIREETENLHVISFEFKEEDVPGFVAVEVASDPQLQNRITDLTDLSVPEIIGAAEEKLAAEEAAAEEQDTEIQQALEEVTVETTDQVFESTKESSSGGGGGYVPPAVKTYNVSAADYNDLTTQLNNAINDSAGSDSVVNITMTNGVSSPGDQNNPSSLSVPENMEVNLNGGQTLAISANDNLQVDGTLNVEEGTTVEVATGGTVSINSANSLHVKGTLHNSGTIYVGTEAGITESETVVIGTTTSPGALVVEETGTLNNEGGRIVIGNGSNFTVNTSVIQSSTIGYTYSFTNSGSIEVSSGGSICLTSDYSSNEGGTITLGQGAEMQLQQNATLHNKGAINSSGIIKNQGTLENYTSNSTITNNGTITNGGIITNAGTINNNGTMDNNHTITNNSKIINGGTLTNYDLITIESGGSLENYEVRELINHGIITDNGTIINNGVITNGFDSDEITDSGTITVSATGTITNSSTGNIVNYNKLGLEGLEDAQEDNGVIISLSNYGTLKILNKGTMTMKGNSGCFNYNTIGVDGGILTVHGDVEVRLTRDSETGPVIINSVKDSSRNPLLTFTPGEGINEPDSNLIDANAGTYSGNAELSFGETGEPVIVLENNGLLQCASFTYPQL